MLLLCFFLYAGVLYSLVSFDPLFLYFVFGPSILTSSSGSFCAVTSGLNVSSSSVIFPFMFLFFLLGVWSRLSLLGFSLFWLNLAVTFPRSVFAMSMHLWWFTHPQLLLGVFIMFVISPTVFTL